MDVNSQEWLKGEQARYAKEAMELDQYLRNSRFRDELLELHNKVKEIDVILSEGQGRPVSQPSPLGTVRKPPAQIALSPMDKVKFELRKQGLIREVEDKIRHDLSKEMLKRREADLSSIRNDERRIQFEAFFKLDEERKKVSIAEAERLAKARSKEEREARRSQAVQGNIPDVSNSFNQAVTRFPQGRVNINHNGQIWEYEGKGNDQQFRINDAKSSPLVVVGKARPETGIEESGNAVLQKKIRSGELETDKSRYDLNLALDMGNHHARHYFKETAKSQNYERIYPGFNQIDGRAAQQATSQNLDDKNYASKYPLYNEIAPGVRNDKASETEKDAGDEGFDIE